MKVIRDNKEIPLTSLEFKIFLMLLLNINKVVTREAILDKIWELSSNYVNDNTLTVYIKRIREKLGTHNINKTIKVTVYTLDRE